MPNIINYWSFNQENRQVRKNKRNYWEGRKEVSFLAENMIDFLENKESTVKLLDWIQKGS